MRFEQQAGLVKPSRLKLPRHLGTMGIAPANPLSFNSPGATLFGSLFQILVPGEEAVVKSVFNFEVHAGWPSSTETQAIHPAFVGVLAPGEYVMRWDADAIADIAFQDSGSSTATSNFAFTLDFAPADAAPTPEPASLLLLGTGIAGVLGLRSRRANRAAGAKTL